jgi:hypothetical protein
MEKRLSLFQMVKGKHAIEWSNDLIRRFALVAHA